MQNVKVDRNRYIGGSDLPAIMGISRYKTRYELLLEKAGLRKETFEGNDFTEYGNAIEPLIRNYINSSGLYFKPFKEDVIIEGNKRYHDDGFNGETVLEIKSTSQIKSNLEDYKTYLVQNIFGIKLRKKEKGLLCVYERPKNFREQLASENIEFDEKRLQIMPYTIDNVKDLSKQIDEAVKQFEIDLERIKENPFLTEEDLLPTNLTEQANKVLELENQLLEFKMLEQKYNDEKEKLRQAMINANCKKWETPNGTKITLIEDKEDEEIEVEYFNEEKFIVENGELYNQYHNKLAEYKETKKEIKKGRKGSLRITLPKEEK